MESCSHQDDFCQFHRTLMISSGTLHILEDESVHYQDDCCRFNKTLVIFWGIIHIRADESCQHQDDCCQFHNTLTVSSGIIHFIEMSIFPSKVEWPAKMNHVSIKVTPLEVR